VEQAHGESRVGEDIGEQAQGEETRQHGATTCMMGASTRGSKWATGCLGLATRRTAATPHVVHGGLETYGQTKVARGSTASVL